MTVIAKIGRRVPRSFKARMISKTEQVLGFQEHLWVMLKMSFRTARRKFINKTAVSKGQLDVLDLDFTTEHEDEFFNLEWMTITIKGDEVAEQDEHAGLQGIYAKLKTQLKGKKDIKDENLGRMFKTSIISEERLKSAYEEGYKQKKEASIQSILLEMGMLIDIQWIKDYDERTPHIDITG